MEEEYGRFFLSNYRGAPLHFGPDESQDLANDTKLWLSNMYNMWLSEDLIKKYGVIWRFLAKGLPPVIIQN